jgi:hypothetical protein
MPAQPFTVHLDPDDLARRTLAAAVPQPSVAPRDAGPAGSARAGRHGARDERAAADLRSRRERAGRAAGAAAGRSYAFRRS